MIEVKNLYLKYIREYYALFNVSFHVAKYEKVAFLGPDESGKTSMLRILAKLEKFNKGEVYIKNISVKRLNLKTDISMCYLPENPVFYEKKSVYENLEIVLKDRCVPEKDRFSMLDKVIIKYNLDKIKDSKVSELSLFEKYKLSLIRFTLRKIEVALIDNIFDKLKDNEVEQIIALIRDIFVNDNTTLIVATSKQEIADKLNLRVIKFNMGSVEKKKSK